MAVKTHLSKKCLIDIISTYNIGEYISCKPFTAGTVETNLFLQTTGGKYVIRYYENRSINSVRFEVNLIRYLKNKKYPCPAPIRNKHGKMIGIYGGKPYVVFEFVEGHTIENPSENQSRELIKKVAELHNITKKYRPVAKNYRWNYGIELCRELARQEAQKINTQDSLVKLKWLEGELSNINLPKSLPKGVCHCDFHFSNVLFQGDNFKALIDFDDANYTYLMFDLVGLIESAAWRREKDRVLNFDEAKKVIVEYAKYRQLNQNEKRHLFDIYKLSILFDCVWYYGRGKINDFYEKRKIIFLNSLGREYFYKSLFSQKLNK